MRQTIGMAVAVVAVLATGLAAQGPNALRVATGTPNRLWIEGTSTVRKYTCTTESVTAVPDPAPEPGAAPSAVKKVEVTVPVKTLDCGNGTMQKHLQHALKADENPDVRFELTRYTLGAKTVDGTEVKATGELTIAGTTKPVELDGVVAPTSGGLRVQGSTAINMKDWGVKPPTLMLGTLRVAAPVTIHYDVVLSN